MEDTASGTFRFTALPEALDVVIGDKTDTVTLNLPAPTFEVASLSLEVALTGSVNAELRFDGVREYAPSLSIIKDDALAAKIGGTNPSTENVNLSIAGATYRQLVAGDKVTLGQRGRVNLLSWQLHLGLKIRSLNLI